MRCVLRHHHWFRRHFIGLFQDYPAVDSYCAYSIVYFYPYLTSLFSFVWKISNVVPIPKGKILIWKNLTFVLFPSFLSLRMICLRRWLITSRVIILFRLFSLVFDLGQRYGFHSSAVALVSSYLFPRHRGVSCCDDFSCSWCSSRLLYITTLIFFVHWWHDRCAEILKISYVCWWSTNLPHPQPAEWFAFRVYSRGEQWSA
jgi:hypothetical protein